jgi:hypothetical protein
LTSVAPKVVSLPNLRIIDFTYGFTGSTHDSTAWNETRMAKDRRSLLKDGEWIWADSAYPVKCHSSSRYKCPDCE